MVQWQSRCFIESPSTILLCVLSSSSGSSKPLSSGPRALRGAYHPLPLRLRLQYSHPWHHHLRYHHHLRRRYCHWHLCHKSLRFHLLIIGRFLDHIISLEVVSAKVESEGPWAEVERSRTVLDFSFLFFFPYYTFIYLLLLCSRVGPVVRKRKVLCYCYCGNKWIPPCRTARARYRRTDSLPRWSPASRL